MIKLFSENLKNHLEKTIQKGTPVMKKLINLHRLQSCELLAVKSLIS